MEIGNMSLCSCVGPSKQLAVGEEKIFSDCIVLYQSVDKLRFSSFKDKMFTTFVNLRRILIVNEITFVTMP